MAPGLHCPNLPGFWKAEAYFTGLLSCWNEIFFPPLSPHRGFPPTEIITIFPEHCCIVFFHLTLEKQRLSWWEGSKVETWVQGLLWHSFIFTALLAMVISATADTVDSYARHMPSQIPYLKILSNMAWIFDHLPQDPVGCLRMFKIGKI